MMPRPSRHVEDPAPIAAACVGKEAFDSPKLAHEVSKRRRRLKGPQDVYRCPYCRAYHIGRPA